MCPKEGVLAFVGVQADEIARQLVITGREERERSQC